MDGKVANVSQAAPPFAAPTGFIRARRVCVVHTANVRNKGRLDGEEAGLRVFW